MAELVDRRDGGGVERCERSGQTGPALIHRLGAAAAQRRDEFVVVIAGWCAEAVQRVLELAADAFTQFLARGARERDDEKLVEGEFLLGHEPGDERGEGPRLARAGAGFDECGALRDGSGDAERLHDVRHGVGQRGLVSAHDESS